MSFERTQFSRDRNGRVRKVLLGWGRAPCPCHGLVPWYLQGPEGLPFLPEFLTEFY